MLDSLALMIGYGVLGVIVLPFAIFAGAFTVVACAALLVLVLESTASAAKWVRRKVAGQPHA